MNTFQMYSSQTGNNYGEIDASNAAEALDKFAKARGFADRKAMWAAGRWEYISAHADAVGVQS
jgi:hypothetical protein